MLVVGKLHSVVEAVVRPVVCLVVGLLRLVVGLLRLVVVVVVLEMSDKIRSPMYSLLHTKTKHIYYHSHTYRNH